MFHHKIFWVPLAAAPALLLLVLLRPERDLTVFLGRFHPVVVHLPIGILFLIALLELVQWLSRKRYQFVTAFPLFVGTASACTAMTLGILLMQGEAMEGTLMERHFRFGIAAAVLAMVTLCLRFWPGFDRRRHMLALYRGALFLTCVLMAMTGHVGASITHGQTYLTDYAPWSLGGKGGHTGEETGGRHRPLAERHIYADLIVPILEAKCFACHSTERAKGGLILDTYEGLLKGGVSAPAVVPGDANNSYALLRIQLPLDDEEHMPPTGEPQLSEPEARILAWWVRNSAVTQQTIAELQPDEDILSDIETVFADLGEAVH